MRRRATVTVGIAGLTIVLAGCASSADDPQAVDPPATSSTTVTTTTTVPPPIATPPVEDAEPRHLDAWVESFADDTGFPIADARCAFSRLAERPIFAEAFDGFLPGEAPFDYGLDAEHGESVVVALTECGLTEHIGGLMAAETGISTRSGVCFTEGLFDVVSFRDAMKEAMITGLGGDGVDFRADLPVEEIAASLVTLIDDCGLARELGAGLGGEMGVSSESGACVMEGMFEIAAYRELLTQSLIGALAGIEPHLGSEVAAAEEIGPTLMALIGDCGVAHELGVALASEMGISTESGACVMERLFELESYRELMQQGLIAGITGQEVDLTDDLVTVDMESAFLEAASDCLTQEEEVALGTDAPRMILDEPFDGPEYAFSTESDSTVDLNVVNGEYRVAIKDPYTSHLFRSLLAGSYPDLRFESTVTLVMNAPGLASVGCWSGDRGYLFTITGDRHYSVLEVESESEGVRHVVTNPRRSLIVEPATRQNRLTVDCVTSPSDERHFSAYVNGVAVVSVPLAKEFGEVTAVGFWALAADDGMQFAVDDVIVEGSSFRPPDVDAALGAFSPPESGSVAVSRHGTTFSYPDDWVYGTSGESMIRLATWNVAVRPVEGPANSIDVEGLLDFTPESLDVTREQLATALATNMAPGLSTPEVIETTVGGLPALSVALGNAKSTSGIPISGVLVLVFAENDTFVLFLQYQLEHEDLMFDAWDDLLESFQP